jgi:hypothetical protein
LREIGRPRGNAAKRSSDNVISTEKTALLWMYCREVAPFETPSLGKRSASLSLTQQAGSSKAPLDEASAGVDKAKAQLHLAQQTAHGLPRVVDRRRQYHGLPA